MDVLRAESRHVRTGVKQPDNEKPTGEWNTVELIAFRDDAIHIVNGRVVMRLKGPTRIDAALPAPVTSGPIHPSRRARKSSTATFKSVPIKAIPPDDLARVGRKLTPKSWPNGSRVAVCLSFDADSEAPLLRDGTTSPTALSAADFGAQSGVPRILAMLDRHQIPATFFVTAVDAMLHPDMIAAIQKSGRHEIGVHGWIHETPTRVTAEEEERLLDQAIEYLTKVTGKRPLGYRAPSWAFSMATLDLIQKKGFLYDSSLQALDEPYEIVSRGKLTGIVELPIDWTLTETPFLGQNGRMPNPAFLYQLYKDEFDGAYQERTMFVLTLHPYLSGHRAPMQHLEQFVTYIKSCNADQFSRTIVKEPGRAAGRTTHPEFRVALQPSPCRVVPSSGPVTGTDSVVPSAERKTPSLALRRPHRAERVKLRKNTVPTPGMPTLPVVSLVPLPPAGIVSTGPSTKRRRNSATRTCCARSRASSAVRSVAPS